MSAITVHKALPIFLLAVLIAGADAASLSEEQRSASRTRCLANLQQKGATGEPAAAFCDCIIHGLDEGFTSGELTSLFGESSPKHPALEDRLNALYAGCTDKAAAAAEPRTSYAQSAMAAVLFIPAAFVSSILMGFALSILNLVGLGVAGLPGIAGNWFANRFGLSPREDSTAARFNRGMYIFTWAGPVYLISQILIFLLQAGGITLVTGFFLLWFPRAATTIHVLGFIWMWMSIGFSGLLAYALMLWVLKIWLGSLGIFWSLMGALF